jgi:NADH:ubiquinone oxidoreductase subunit 2 (subunit N)
LKIEDLVFLKNSNMFLALSFCFCILSLAGIPPGGLFFSKFFLMFFVGCESYTGLVIVCIFFILNSVSMFYYFRLIKLVVIVPKPTDCLLVRNLNYGTALILVLVLVSLVLFTVFYANLFDFFFKVWLS